MDLVLTEDQDLLSKTAADFVAEHSPVSRFRKLRDTRDATGFSRELWKEMAGLGWVGIPFPEEFGGAGLGFAELAVVLEQLGRKLAPEPFLSTVLLGGQALLLGGSDAQKKEWLPRLVSGDAILSVAYQEAKSRYDLRHVTTKAEKAGDGWTLTGEKIQVLDAHVADALVVAARTAGGETDAEGITLFLVRKGAPGLSVERQSRVDSRNAGLVRLAGVRVGPVDVVGEVGRGGALLERVVDRASAGLCAEMLGSMQQAAEDTFAYLKTRVQFGVPIGSFQALKHRAAKMYIELELARSCVMAAVRAVDANDEDLERLVSLAKARCSDAGVLIANEAVQMHGGVGMTDEYDVGFYMKRARVAEMTFGDATWHRDRFARLSGY
ncbi:MAG TPA: acyl-CoA dehydrogenase family protein [Myxococcota bacterium]|jgi:acyl-CoA dehydrogenase|nr:acyl-CoA dehydrogenase family protein [Myxococcota bacterium]